MKRSVAREIAFKLCLSVSENPDSSDFIFDEFFNNEYYSTLASEDEIFTSFPDDRSLSYIKRVVNGIKNHDMELDSYIEKFSRGWTVSRLSSISIAILKLAMYEILYMPDIPSGVSANEAVELSKKYDEPELSAFINGIIGNFIREEADL